MSSAKPWQLEAAAWLRAKAAEQQRANERWPEHAKCYPSWLHRVEDRQRLAMELNDEVLAQQALSVGAPKQEPGP